MLINRFNKFIILISNNEAKVNSTYNFNTNKIKTNLYLINDTKLYFY